MRLMYSEGSMLQNQAPKSECKRRKVSLLWTKKEVKLTAISALDVEEFLHADVRTESAFRNYQMRKKPLSFT